MKKTEIPNVYTKLMKLLCIIGEMETYEYENWKLVGLLVESMDKIKVIEKKWGSWYKRDSYVYPLDLSKIETWRALARDIKLVFSVKDKELFCDVEIYERSYSAGRELNFTATLQVPNKFVLNLKDTIQHEFDKTLDVAYDMHLDALRAKWINEMKESILNTL